MARRADRKAAGPPGQTPDPEVAARAAAFRTRLERHEERLYGAALFFECLSVLFDGQEAVIETHRKQFRNIIEAGKRISQQAEDLLREVEQDPRRAPELDAFPFAFGEGHADPDAIAKRADALLEAYAALFPGRPRSQPFSHADVLRLIEAAACACDRLPREAG